MIELNIKAKRDAKSPAYYRIGQKFEWKSIFGPKVAHYILVAIPIWKDQQQKLPPTAMLVNLATGGIWGQKRIERSAPFEGMVNGKPQYVGWHVTHENFLKGLGISQEQFMNEFHILQGE